MAPNGTAKFSKKKKDTEGTEWFEASVNGGVLILQGIQQAAQFAPVPFLQQAATATLQIVTTIQAVRYNKEEFERLAEDAAAIVYAIWTSFEKSEDQKAWPGKQLLDVIVDLLRTLHCIQDFVRNKGRRNIFRRVVFSSEDVKDIKEYRERLQQAISKFEISSDLEMHETLRQIKSTLAKMEKATSNSIDGTNVQAMPDSLITVDAVDVVRQPQEPEEKDTKLIEDILNRDALERLMANERAYFRQKQSKPSPIGKAKKSSRRTPPVPVEIETSDTDGSSDENPSVVYPAPRARAMKPNTPAPTAHHLLPAGTNGYGVISSALPYMRSPPMQPPGVYGAAAYYPPYPQQHPAYPFLGSLYGGYVPPGATSVTNTNSGNVTTTTISNVGNDNSVRVTNGARSRRR